MLARVGGYLKQALAAGRPIVAPVARWYADGTVRLSDRVMAVDYLSRAGPARSSRRRTSCCGWRAQLAWEDRVRLALVLARGGDRAAARALLEPAWR